MVKNLYIFQKDIFIFNFSELLLKTFCLFIIVSKLFIIFFAFYLKLNNLIHILYNKFK